MSSLHAANNRKSSIPAVQILLTQHPSSSLLERHLSTALRACLTLSLSLKGPASGTS